MRFTLQVLTPGIPQEKIPEEIRSLLSELSQKMGDIDLGLNGFLTFGDGVSLDNIAGQWITYNTNAVVNTEDTISHTLNAIPPGFILMVPPVTGTINKGTTAWTSTNIYLKCTGASQTCKLFLLSPPSIFG